MRRVVFLACMLFAPAAWADVHHSSDLGWTDGQDVTDSFEDFLNNTFQPGDELRLDHTYQIHGTHELPDNFTLSAVVGAGFEVTDADSDQGRQFLHLGNGNTLSNLTLTYLNTPAPGPRGTNPVSGQDYYPMTGITVSDKSDIRIEYCKMHGSIGHHLKVAGGSEIEVVGSHMLGGFWTTYLAGNVSNVTFQHTVVEQFQGDAIKTGRGGAFGVKSVLVDSCVFQDGGRDGIDTTGGFLDSTVRNTIMRRLFSGLDIKSYFESEEHLSMDCLNQNISIENSTFVDMANAVVLSTIDRGLEYNDGVHFLTPDSAQVFAPHDVDIQDCIFERTGESDVRMLLMKGGHSVAYDNAQFCGEGIGEVKYTNVFDTFGPDTLSEEVSDALNHSVSGTLGAACLASAPGDTSVPFAYGPQATLPTNPDAGVDGGGLDAGSDTGGRDTGSHDGSDPGALDGGDGGAGGAGTTDPQADAGSVKTSADNESEGCSCSAPRGKGSPWALLCLVLLLPWTRRRRALVSTRRTSNRGLSIAG